MSDPKTPAGGAEKKFPASMVYGVLIAIVIVLYVIMPGCTDALFYGNDKLATISPATKIVRRDFQEWMAVFGGILLFLGAGGLIIYSMTKKKDGGAAPPPH